MALKTGFPALWLVCPAGKIVLYFVLNTREVSGACDGRVSNSQSRCPGFDTYQRHMGGGARKQVFRVSDQVPYKPAYAAKEYD